jgi:hypothetical protein
LARDLRKAAAGISRRDSRWLIDQYYTLQHHRIAAAAQTRTSHAAGEPVELIEWVFDSMARFEAAIKGALLVYAKGYRVGNWCLAQCGIGPVLAAAGLAHFDIRNRPTVGHFWRFAGLDPTLEWSKGQKRPYNGQLKTICAYKIGESFVKQQNREACFYGKLLIAKKKALAAANQAGEYAAEAQREMARFDTPKKRKTMESTQRWQHWTAGRLCPQHIHDRARRWAVKLYLSHLHQVMYEDYYGAKPPNPYIFDHPGDGGSHSHLIAAPLWPKSAAAQAAEFAGRGLGEMFSE